MHLLLAGVQYQPVPELGNNKELEPFFPDGTKCHEDESGSEYYCRDRRCLPGSGGRGRGARAGPAQKIPILNNASPDEVRDLAFVLHSIY